MDMLEIKRGFSIGRRGYFFHLHPHGLSRPAVGPQSHEAIPVPVVGGPQRSAVGLRNGKGFHRLPSEEPEAALGDVREGAPGGGGGIGKGT